MTFAFTEEELSYISKKYGYKYLVGFESVKFNKERCITALLEKGYIYPYKRAYELSNDVRLLLSAWVRMKYTLVRDSFMSDQDAFALFANENHIMTFSYHGEEVRLNLGDFSATAMDETLAQYLGITDDVVPADVFNITFTADDYLTYFEEETPVEQIAKETGLGVKDICAIKETLVSGESTSFVLQNVVNDIGCMGTFKKYNSAYILVKHIVPNTHLDRQRVVVVKGNSKDIVDSIYIL